VRRLARGRCQLPGPAKLRTFVADGTNTAFPAWVAIIMKGHRHFVSVALVAALLSFSNSCSAETGERPHVGDAAPAKTIRTHRLRVPADFFSQEAVRFETAHVEMSGTISADGHSLQLYGAVLIRRNRICTSTAGARWACGQRAFMALRSLIDGKSIICSFNHVTEPPKAICRVGNSDVTHFLLSDGWAELADGVNDETYVEAVEAAQSRKAGIWGDGPP
jgi:endonuclease YncB( thermonuclease family)